MRRRGIALFAGILLLGLMPGPALAAGMVDQSNVVTGDEWGGKTFAQTVTVGRTANLTGVDLKLLETVESKTTVSIEDLYRGNGLPIGPARASATVTVSSRGWYHFELPTPLFFLAGGHFAIVFSVTSQGVAMGSTGTYPGGQAYSYGSTWTPLNGDKNLDFDFRTYVEDAPAPTAVPVPTAPGQLVTQPPLVTPAPTQKAVPAATVKPAATALPAPSKLGASPVSTDLVALATADSTAPATADSAALPASASPGAATEPQSDGPIDSGGPPILLIIGGIVALAAVLGGGIGLGLLLARRQHGAPPAG